MTRDDDYEISTAAYQWSGRVFRLLERMLRLRISLDHQPRHLRDGEIFLFNHFARFETFIPQYLIYRETGAVCRSVAAPEFFVEGSPLSEYLRNVGAVPADHPRLLSFLGEEILRGRKVVIFPEGGMVKDHRVVGARGGYEAYSRSAGRRRKQHTGAAVLALTLDAFKSALLELHRRGGRKRLGQWVERLKLESEEELLEAARRSTLVVPANITFYPIRVGDNLLHQVGELLTRGLSRRMAEELLIEGNILLKDTDMNVRMAEPLAPGHRRCWWERRLLGRLEQEADSTADFFDFAAGRRRWGRRLLEWKLGRRAGRMRDRYMHRIYTGVTVHLSHLASLLVMTLVRRGLPEVDRNRFHKMLYVSLKLCQKQPSLHLHASLTDPDAYQDLPAGGCTGLQRFLRVTGGMRLIDNHEGRYRLLPKLLQKQDFDQIRLHNLVSVYANEVTPVPEVGQAVTTAMEKAPLLDDRTVSRMRFDDELRSHALDRRRFDLPRHQEINRQQTATGNGEPFLLLPRGNRPLGVVLVHGLLASPAEVRDFGERLGVEGYPVIGVRLKGHGTSPWDLRERAWEEWLGSVRRGFRILAPFASRLCLVGFSTGGALSLLLAAESPSLVAGVAAASPPVRLKDPAMVFVPLLHGANRITRWISSLEGVKPFHAVRSEHPHINYRHVPVRSLYELQGMARALGERADRVGCPTLLLQGTADPVVDPDGARLLRRKVGERTCRLEWIPSSRHGILHEDIAGTQARILSFLSEL